MFVYSSLMVLQYPSRMIASEAGSWWRHVNETGCHRNFMRLCDARYVTHRDTPAYALHIARRINFSRNLSLAAGRSSQHALIGSSSVDRKLSVTASECVTESVIKIVL